MAYSDDAVRAKLSALNETQDSIVTVAQWIMFHRRHADKTASLWLTRLQDSTTAKRLNLIYLANEVVQQSRARGKHDFLLAFEPLIAEATALAYKNASQEVQGKIKRVVEVWRQRNIFDVKIQEGTEKRLEELDRARGGGGLNGSSGKGRLGGALFGGGSGNVPSELEAVAKAQSALSKADAEARPAIGTADMEFAKTTDPNTPLPTPPVHAAKLNTLIKHLAKAQGAVEASIRARRELLSGLEKLIESNRSKLAEDEVTLTNLSTRKEGVEIKKKEVEDGIMRGLSTPSSPDLPTPTSGHANGNVQLSDDVAMVERPEAESLTPPPPDVESFTPPPGEETLGGDPAPFIGDATPLEQNVASTTGAEPPPAFEPPSMLHTQDPSAATQANDFLNSLNVGQLAGQVRQASTELQPDGGSARSSETPTADPRLKRRKMNHAKRPNVDEDIFGAAGGVDEDGVSALLGS